MATDKPNIPSPIIYEIADDFVETYANNVYYESSVWDLKLIFGQLDQREGKVKIAQHTAITLPWMQAKLFSFWLRGQIEAHEMINGKIQLSASIIPGEMPPPTEEQKKSDANADAIFVLFNRLRAELIADMKGTK